MALIALIPARSGSKRIPNKNIKELAGHPLIAYTVQAAKDAGIFDRIIVSTDSHLIGGIAMQYGAKYIPRNSEYRDGPHFPWIIELAIRRGGLAEDSFALLFPTNPFRTGETIKKAWLTFVDYEIASSLISIKQVKEHPWKMWDSTQLPHIFPILGEDEKLYNLPSEKLGNIYVQNANFRIFKYETLMKGDELGNYILGYETTMPEALDINDEYDWMLAETLIEKGLAKLPEIKGDDINA